MLMSSKKNFKISKNILMLHTYNVLTCSFNNKHIHSYIKAINTGSTELKLCM